MDRTEASDAFNAGSIPVGCTLYITLFMRNIFEKGRFMFKEKIKLIGSFFVKNSKIVLPVVLILAVAITVSVALKANDTRVQEESASPVESTEVASTVVQTEKPSEEEAPLTENTDPDLVALIDNYYAAYMNGDVEGIRSISNYLEETEAIRIEAMSEYIVDYPEKTIYTKPGPMNNSYLAYVYYKMVVNNFEEQIPGMETFYVCTNEEGKLYLNEGEVSDEELEYISTLATQEDVVELYNRVNVECSDVFLKNENLYYYIMEIVNEVQKTTGETLAEQMGNAGESTDSSESFVEVTGTVAQMPDPTAIPVEGTSTETVYAKATTTVNVRSSDSENADKVGKVSRGTKVEVTEQRVNGWTKVKADGVEGFIKSEYLQLPNVAGNVEVVGTVTAIENVNVRTAADENADRLGILAGGEVVDLLARENGWCKINYGGQIGYVKEDYVQ